MIGFGICAFFPTIAFFVMLLFKYDLIYSLAVFAVTAVLLIIIASSFLLRHPMLRMLEGSGLLVWDLSSPGIIRSFLAKVRLPYLDMNIGGKKKKSSIFDRESVSYLTPPEPATVTPTREFDNETGRDEDFFVFRIPKRRMNEAAFGLDGRPVILYNSALGSFLTKDMLGDTEKKAFVEHGALYLNRRVDELTASIRDFARYIVDQTKPRNFFADNKLLLIIIVIVVAVLLIMFLPSLLGGAQKAASSLTGAVSKL